jgi:hypothetical protein
MPAVIRRQNEKKTEWKKKLIELSLIDYQASAMACDKPKPIYYALSRQKNIERRISKLRLGTQYICAGRLQQFALSLSIF